MSTPMRPPDSASTRLLNTVAILPVALSKGSLLLGWLSLIRRSAARLGEAAVVCKVIITAIIKDRIHRVPCRGVRNRRRRLDALLNVIVFGPIPIWRRRFARESPAALHIDLRSAVARILVCELLKHRQCGMPFPSTKQFHSCLPFGALFDCPIGNAAGAIEQRPDQLVNRDDL